MAETNEYKLYKIDKSLYPDSRQRKLRRYLDDNGREMSETYEKIVIEHNENDIYHSVGPGEENRLDLLAHKFYRNENLWWIIAEANDIVDPLRDIPAGTVLRIPDISRIYGFKGILA